MKDGEHVFEKQTRRYFPFGKRSTHDDGTIDKPSGTLATLAVLAIRDDAEFEAPVHAASDSDNRSVSEERETLHDTDVRSNAPSDTATSGISAPSASEISTASSDASGKAGTKKTLSGAYPANEVVSPRGMAGSPEETVLSDDIEVAVLIRNSDEVEELTRNAVLGSVVHEKTSRRTGPTTVADEKWPHVLETLSA